MTRTLGMTVDKGIPMPADRKQKYPWHEMEVGDSFIVPDGKERQIRSAASGAGIRHGKKFSVRVDARDQLRVWRLK